MEDLIVSYGLIAGILAVAVVDFLWGFVKGLWNRPDNTFWAWQEDSIRQMRRRQ